MTTPPNPWGQRIAPDGRLWISAPELERLSRRKWSPEFEELERAPILVVDDLGEELRSEESVAMISSLLTCRMGARLPTIITTNLNGQAFQGRYGERIVDRVRQSGLDENGKARWWVRCVGPSMRGAIEPYARDFTEPDPSDPGEGPKSAELAAEDLAARSRAAMLSIAGDDADER
jgi:hypothetical protein